MSDEPVVAVSVSSSPCPAVAVSVSSPSSVSLGWRETRVGVESLLKRRFVVGPAFEIYGGSAGLFDYGPVGCVIKTEIETIWRNHFVIAEDLLEVSGPCLTPHSVLKASGHVDRFTDAMVTDVVTHACFRADKLIEDWVEAKLNNTNNNGKKKCVEEVVVLSEDEKTRLERLAISASSLDCKGLDEAISKNGIKSPETGNELSKSYPFNLMFKTQLGPKASSSSSSSTNDSENNSTIAFLRPETAQGIFVNFARLLDFNGGKIPFGAAQLGLGFRNEIAPRNGLLRVREFQMAEIEYFVDPTKKNQCPKFDSINQLCLPLFPRANQMGDMKVVGDVSLESAVSAGTIANKTLGYFLGRTFLFLRSLGIKENCLRFRQHLDTEMAHYADDCWDAEILTSYGWIECVGHADRAAFDLTEHSKHAKVSLRAFRHFDEPKIVTFAKVVFNRQVMGPKFKKDAKLVEEEFMEKSDQDKLAVADQLAKTGKYEFVISNGNKHVMEPSMVQIQQVSETRSEESYTPSVIEPSFGIGRIIYCVLEHSFRSRSCDPSEERTFLSLPALIAPFKCSILPISSNQAFLPLIAKIQNDFKQHELSCKCDSSTASIGKRYARTDEIGIPFAITIDFQSVQDETVTLRERDSMVQVRLPASEVASVVKQLVRGSSSGSFKSWAEVANFFPIFTEQQVS